MLNRKDLEEISALGGDDEYFVSLYLDVDHRNHKEGDFVVKLKSMLKETSDGLGRNVLKKVGGDLRAIGSYVGANKREFKKALAVISSGAGSFWREYHLSVPVRSELIVDRAPYIKPLLDVLDNNRAYAVLLVDKESARIFVVRLGEICEYGEVHTPGVPGKHKKGGWYALAATHYERHIDYHVGLHLKDVVKRLEKFLMGEQIGRLIVGGTGEALSMIKEMLPNKISEKIIGTFHAGMFEPNSGIMKKARPILEEFELVEEARDVGELIARSEAGDRAVTGLDDVLRAVQQGRVMKLVLERGFKSPGRQCTDCRALSAKGEVRCPYCGGPMQNLNCVVDHAAHKSVEQGAAVQVVDGKEVFSRAGKIGAFLRF